MALLFGLTAFAAGISFAIKGYHEGGEYMALGGMLGVLYMCIGWIMTAVSYFAAKGKCPL